MKIKALPLEEVSISELYNGANLATYEVPIYQRNYAWEKDEISTLIQDVYDSYKKNPKGVYYIGTLVSYHKGDRVFEVIDGQQRLTTINIILAALHISVRNKLTYRARKKSNDTIKSMPLFDLDEKDIGIMNGYTYTENAINEIILKSEKEAFGEFFLRQVHIIHYQAPKDIDLNHYFEIMNSRGEQLEKHEIIKARLISIFNEGSTEEEKEKSRQDRSKFNYIWENCSDMFVYVQQKSKNTSIFGEDLCDFVSSSFDDIDIKNDANMKSGLSIDKLIAYDGFGVISEKDKNKDKPDSFQPIINFSNFLLIVLKLTRTMLEKDFVPTGFNLDDKELINEFNDKKIKIDASWVKVFGFNLIKAKFFLDNYIVHHSNEDDTVESNPWMLQKWQKEGKKGYLKNLAEGNDGIQQKLVHLLSMFEVSFTARQRKNYLFYCLLYLFRTDSLDSDKYCEFVEKLAVKYFKDVYLFRGCLNENNTPMPGSFDNVILLGGEPSVKIVNNENSFKQVYGDGSKVSKGIPLFVFNYLDYKIWLKYADELRGEKKKESSRDREGFFETLGCSDFGLKVFDMFYFSRTRRSLEHFFPQANAGKEGDLLDNNQINSLGNYAMIGSQANSSGSNWSPKVKLDHYLDSSGKIKQVSVATLKFMIMMQACKDNEIDREPGKEWIFEDIIKHQEKMINILF